MECQHHVNGRYGNYCSLLVASGEIQPFTDPEDCKACVAWELAKRQGGVMKLPDPLIPRSDCAMRPEYITDFFVGEGHILAVEDNIVNMSLLQKTLGDLGSNMLKAANGREALKMIETHTDIRLILLDIHMPEMDGLEFMHVIHKDIPMDERNFSVFIVSDLTDWDMAKKILDMGAFGYIKKPIHKQKLIQGMADAMLGFEDEKYLLNQKN